MKFLLSVIYKTALHIAASLGMIDIIRLLLQHNQINVNATDEIFKYKSNEVISDISWFFIFFWKKPVDLCKNEEVKALF